MSEQNEKTVIAVKTDEYSKAKSASGKASMHNGDIIASTLVGMSVIQVATVAAIMLGGDNTAELLMEKYAHLNIGQQRMNLGNRIRGAVNKADKENAKAQATFDIAHDAFIKQQVDGAAEGETVLEEPTELELVSGADRLIAASADIVAEVKAATEAAEAEKEAKAKAAAEAKAEKEAAKKAKTEEAEETETEEA